MSDRRTTNFSQKGFQGNLLAFMKKLEKNQLCCLDFLESIFTEDSSSIDFSGNGTQSNPLIAVSKISSSVGNALSIHTDGLFVSSGGTGTVTSVGLSLPSFITVSGSPVTGSGVLTGTLATQVANRIFAGPATGVAAAPTFRALVAADIPAPVAFSGITIGSIGNAKAINLGQIYDAGITNAYLQYDTEIPMNGHKFTFGLNGVQEVTVDALSNLLIAGAINGSLSTPALDVSQAWNTTGTGTMFRLTAFNNQVGTNPLLTDFYVSTLRVQTTNIAGQISAFRTGLPTATFHAGASTTIAGTAPLKFDVGVLMTTPETGAFEFDGTNLHFTVGGVRKTVTLT